MDIKRLTKEVEIEIQQNEERAFKETLKTHLGRIKNCQQSLDYAKQLLENFYKENENIK